jgi:transcription initiation factor TFIIIB Brf1 subunit/transcription initiation factor TFIIB
MNHFQIPKPIRLRVFTLVKQAQAQSLLQGRAYHTIIPSLLYLVCQERNFPLRLRKITSELDIPNHIFFKYIRVMAAELKISNNKHKQNIHVTKTCDELNILFLEREVALLLQKIPFYIKNGKKPSGILGGVIYYFSQKKHLGITYQQISNIVKVTEPCIRARFREIRKWIQQIKEGNNQK